MKFLIIIDVQKDFALLALGTKEAKAIIPHVVERINDATGKVVITTRDTHGEDYLQTLEGKKLPVVHCKPGTDGWELVDEIQNALENNSNINAWFDVCKTTFGYLKWQGLLDAYGEVEEIEICGLCTDICVVSNALILRAMYPNVKIVIHQDCCAGVTPELHEAALKVLNSCQIDVI